MSEVPFIILTCPGCGVKNRVRKFDSQRIPVCSKCRARLLDPEEHDVQARYERSLNRFFDLPGLGLRSDPPEDSN